jgi:hypothetical protein
MCWTKLLTITSLSIVFLFVTFGSTDFVFSSPPSAVSPSSLALTTDSFNNNHQSLQLPPIANAGPNQVVTNGSTVILNGSSSRAPNGIILSYSWKQIPTDAQITLSGVNTPVWEFKAPNVSADTPLRFQLNVTDNLGQVGTAFVNVLDKPASTSAPLSSEQSRSMTIQPPSKIAISNNRNASGLLPLSIPSMLQTRLNMVKITSPIKDQHVPVHSSLTMTGTSIANSTSVNCQVSVIVNGIKPYQRAVATGIGGANDYSTWIYRLTPAYAAIKEGQNKITAMFSCGNNPSFISHNSVNVIGVTNSNPSIIAANSQRFSLLNNNSKPFISIDLEKNPITAGDIETLKIMVTDAAVSNATIAGASVHATVTDSTNTITTKFNGTTDNSGIFTHTWKISKDSKPGVFSVSALTSATGYKSLLIPTRATFIVSPAVEQQEILPQQHKTFNCRFFIVAPGPCA